MKKINLILVCMFLCLALASCKSNIDENKENFEIICTSHVVADWVENIIVAENSKIDVIVLEDNGKDMHNFQPSAADIRNVYKCDLLIYIGGESDSWADGMKENEGFPDSMRLLDIVEGKNCDDCIEEEHHHEYDEFPDEHIWLSFENAALCIEKISDVICELFEEEAENIRNNLTNYLYSLEELQKQYKQAVETAKYKTVVFADRFPFVYLMNELGIEYCAAFPGCSSESSASFETIIKLAKKVNDNKLPCVLTIEDSKTGIAEKVVEYVSNTEVRILAVDSMQIYNAESDFDYLSVMDENLKIFKVALGVSDG